MRLSICSEVFSLSIILILSDIQCNIGTTTTPMPSPTDANIKNTNVSRASVTIDVLSTITNTTQGVPLRQQHNATVNTIHILALLNKSMLHINQENNTSNNSEGKKRLPTLKDQSEIDNGVDQRKLRSLTQTNDSFSASIHQMDKAQNSSIYKSPQQILKFMLQGNTSSGEQINLDKKYLAALNFTIPAPILANLRRAENFKPKGTSGVPINATEVFDNLDMPRNASIINMSTDQMPKLKLHGNISMSQIINLDKKSIANFTLPGPMSTIINRAANDKPNGTGDVLTNPTETVDHIDMAHNSSINEPIQQISKLILQGNSSTFEKINPDKKNIAVQLNSTSPPPISSNFNSAATNKLSGSTGVLNYATEIQKVANQTLVTTNTLQGEVNKNKPVLTPETKVTGAGSGQKCKKKGGECEKKMDSFLGHQTDSMRDTLPRFRRMFPLPIPASPFVFPIPYHAQY